MTYFSSGEDDLTRDEDEKNDLGLDHSIDQSREQLRLGRFPSVDIKR